MATHIDSVAGSQLPKLVKAEFYASIRGGDLVFCSGREPISVAIERETGSPFSHVLMVWVFPGSKEWLTLEATFGPKGVHVGRFADYVDSYDGDLVLARRSKLTQADIVAELDAGLALVDDGYDWQSEVTFAAHRLLKILPVQNPKGELYCSGLQQVMSQASPYPIVTTGPILATPEQIYTDASVEAVCALVRGSN